MLDHLELLFERGGFYAYMIAGLSLLTYTLLIEHALTLRGMANTSKDASSEVSFTFVRALIASAPLLGLLGTVSGMVQIFQSFEAQASTTSLLSDGLSEAMVTTQLGLIVAAPALLIERVLSRQAKRRMDTTEFSTNAEVTP